MKAGLSKIGWLLAAFCIFLLYWVPAILLAAIGLLALLFFFCWQTPSQAPSSYYPGRTVAVFRLGWFEALWGNWQNGVDGASGDDLPAGWPAANWPRWLQILVWSGIRNPVGNDRWHYPFGIAVDPAKVSVCFASSSPVSLTSGYFLIRQGLFFQLRFSWTSKYQCRIGWGIAEETAPTGIGVGFSTKLVTAV